MREELEGMLKKFWEEEGLVEVEPPEELEGLNMLFLEMPWEKKGGV